jgi:hypothetical protein
MANNSIKVTDIYDGLGNDSKGQLIYLAGEIKKHARSATSHFMEVAKMIDSAHSELASVGRGGRFAEWCESKCDISKSAAYRYLAVHKAFGNSPKLGLLNPVSLIELSASSVPESAREEAAELSLVEPITQAKAKAIIDKHKPPTVTKKVEVIDAEFEVVEESEPEHKPEPPRQRQPIDKKQQSANLRNEILQHNAKMMRLVDDLNGVYLDKEKHSIVHKAFREIHATVEAWK